MIVEIRPGEGGDHSERFALEIEDAIVACARREKLDFYIERSDRTTVIDVAGSSER